MDVTRQIERKADPGLLHALSEARGDEVLRVVFLVGPANAVPADEPAPEPAEFEDREDYRRALIDRRNTHLQVAIGPTLAILHQLGLNPRGGTKSRSVVAEGSARAIAEALSLPGVEHATLDRPISSPAPRRPQAAG